MRSTQEWTEHIIRLNRNRGVIDQLKYDLLPKEWQKSPEETGFQHLIWPTWQASFLMRHADRLVTDDIMNAVGENLLSQGVEGLWNKGTGSKRYIMWEATSWRNLFAIFYCLFRDVKLLGQGWETLHFREGTRPNVTAVVPLEKLFDR